MSASTLIPHFIGGQRQTKASPKSIPVTSPGDGSVLGSVQPAEPSYLDEVVKVAAKAFETWQHVPLKERIQPLFRYKQLVEQNMDELSSLVSQENGKTKAEAKAGIEKGLEVVEFACSLPQVMAGELLEVSSGVDCYSRRLPLGVVAGITPFNFPAMVPMWMFPLAIAAGNTFILKPSEQVPLTPLRLAELLKEAGLPDGVFNVLQGDRTTVESILDHPAIQAVAFVGSTAVAKQVYLRGTNAGKRVLALGGAKNHLVVVPDADPQITAKNVASSALGCAGQRCMAASVLIAVGKSDEIVDGIVEAAKAFRCGNEMGAIISAAARDRILGYIDRAEKRGAKIRLDGRGVKVEGKAEGYYVGPTIIDGITREDESLSDEIFGPVLSIIRVDTLDEALEIENKNPYGNAASIYTSSGGTALYFETHASAGMIGVNIGVPVPREPFAFGGWNESKFGVGDVTGRDGVSFWTKTKKVTKKWTAKGPGNWMS